MNVNADNVRSVALEVINDANIIGRASDGESAMACVQWIDGVLEMMDAMIKLVT